MRVGLALGADPEHAIRVIKEIVGGSSTALRPASQHAVDMRDDYVRWAMDAEARLESVLRREDARALFDTPRHRDIASSFLGNHLITMIHAELAAKRREFEDAASDLECRLDRMRRARGIPVVVDSNVLLQSQRPDSVNWSAELESEVRLILPLRVIEEIDAKKYSSSTRLRDRARGLLPWINSLFSAGDIGPIQLRPDATLELLMSERPRYRPEDADEEVLDVCHEVVRFAGGGRLMTADTAMRLRALSEGLEVLFVEST
jgi:hypothetical protein